MKNPKRPSDANQLAKLVMEMATGSRPIDNPVEETDAMKSGRKGGLSGGKGRAAALTGKKQSEIAKKAAKARWDKP